MAKTETYKEPPPELLEYYFQEIREGRSRKSVVNALRKEGYTISETVLRHRYEVWLAYQQAKEEFEKRLNQIKGELLKSFRDKIEELQRTFEKETQKTNLQVSEVSKVLMKAIGPPTYDAVVEELKKPEEEQEIPWGFIWDIEEKLLFEIEAVRSELNQLKEEIANLRKQNHLLAKALWAVLSGIYYKDKKSGLLERKDLWDHVSEGLTQEDINKVSRLAKNS